MSSEPTRYGRFSIRSLLVVTAVVAAICAACAALLDLPISRLPYWVGAALAPPATWFYIPGVLSIVVCLHWAYARRERRLAGLAATVTGSLVILAPALSMWWTWEIVGDHTANIGAGLLLFAEPIAAPVAAALGWVVGGAIQTGIRRPPARTP